MKFFYVCLKLQIFYINLRFNLCNVALLYAVILNLITDLNIETIK